jgi:hypothetical protein
LQLYSDIGFMVPILIEAKAKARAGWPVYFYLTDYFNPPRARKHFPIEGQSFF